MAWAYFAARRGRQRGACRDLLRPADPHRARRADRDGDRRPGARAAPCARRAGRQRGADPVLPAPPERGRRRSRRWSRRCRTAHQFIGVGLDSSERGHPPEKFARVFARCRELGLHRGRACRRGGAAGLHRDRARRAAGASASTTACAASKDPALVQRLARERMPLTVCPLSNVKLCVFDTMADHNLPALLDAGLCATVNSDDPAYFGGYINDNFVADLRGAAAAGRAPGVAAGAQQLRRRLRRRCAPGALARRARRGVQRGA